MRTWTDGDLYAEFEQRLDGLIAELCPRWEFPRLPEPCSPEQLAYERRNAKRLRVGAELTARPDVAALHGSGVLNAIACDEDVSFNRQLISPMLAVLGRRAVQRYLVSVVETGPEHKKVCAVRAWYWCQVSLRYTSAQAFDTRQPTRDSSAMNDEVVDLRGAYRIACLTAFVSCQQAETREWLAGGFLLRNDYYPANLHALVAQARVIAETDPDRFEKLIGREDDGTNMATLGLS